MRGKAAESNTVTAPRQDNLLEVDRSEAAREADRWIEIQADIENKKQLLIDQTEKVLRAMQGTEQQTMSLTDSAGFKHVFSIINVGEKLHHSKREEN
jgi:hypothetical protein